MNDALKMNRLIMPKDFRHLLCYPYSRDSHGITVEQRGEIVGASLGKSLLIS